MLYNIIELIVILLFIFIIIYKIYDYLKYKFKLWKVKNIHDIDFNNNVSYNIYWKKYKCKNCDKVIVEQRSQAHEYSHNQRFEFNDYINIYECKHNQI